MAWEIGIPLLVSGIILAFGFLSVKLSKEHGPIQFLLLFICMFTMWVSMSIGIEMAKIESLTSIANMLTGLYQIILYATVFMLLYFLIMMVYNIYRNRKAEKATKDNEDGYYDEA